ncbi:MAG: L,D-transpeptidase [Candidatus Latescibacterota bacterium]
MTWRGRSVVLIGFTGAMLLDPTLKSLGATAWREGRRLPETIAWRRLGPEAAAARADSLQREVTRLRASIEELSRAEAERRPEGPYIVVDTASNRLLMWKDGQVLVDAVCSTGSGRELVHGKRRWVFHTPRGVREVLYKQYLPVWLKPDWAFIEENEKIPAAGSPERLEEAVLGEYALGMGDGYLIHGTLWKRYLGQSVTHGCVRLDDADLELVYNNAVIGTPIYIF